MLHFEEFDADNWRLNLHVAQEQERYVASLTTTLARAWAFRHDNSCAYLIRREDTPVGAVLWYDWPEEDMYVLSEFFIDERYQHQGLGYQAMCQALDMMADEARHPAVTLCYIAGNEAAHRLYQKLGFEDYQFAGEEPYDGEPCMLLSLDAWRQAHPHPDPHES